MLESHQRANIASIRKRLLAWFDREQRSLPWRGQRDPYRILVSEVMLQQTRVAVVEERYKLFLRQFPTIERLARARKQTVLAAWSGLGYYRRARSLHAAAKQINKSGAFPHTALQLRELPGVGRYTANAVASIAFGEPVAVVDGNVKRVLRRLLGPILPLHEEAYWDAAARLLDQQRPGDFNQAMMELGALVCLPGQPLCQRCPVASHCDSQGADALQIQAPRRKATLHYALVGNNGAVLLRQRASGDSLMPGMWELPECRKPKPRRAPLLKLRHSITVTDYTVLVFAGNVRRRDTDRWVPLRSAHRLPLTGLARKILGRLAF
jgi:A/G-specific adenine glycosylase